MIWSGVLKHTWIWTEQVIADGVADDDGAEIGIGFAKRIMFEWNTNGATTGTPNFDFHLYASIDGSTWTSLPYKTLASAVPKDVVGTYVFTATEVGPTMIKAELDVNAANLVATEYVTLRMYVYY